MPFCPACGDPAPDDARFCMRCGKELTALPPKPGQSPPPAPPAEAPPVPAAETAPPAPETPQTPQAPPAGQPSVPPPPASPPPPPPAAPPFAPAYGPGPAAAAAPSPAALFARRVFAGPWEWAAGAAGAAAATTLGLALVIATLTQGTREASSAGFLTRARIALAVLAQGLGSNLHLSQSFTDSPAYSDSGDGLLSGADAGSDNVATSTTTVSGWVLTATALWVVALILMLRRARRRQTGPEAAVRVALLCAAAAGVLTAAAQPSVGGDDLTTNPLAAVLWTFLISLVTALLTLSDPRVGPWLAVRPGTATALRALRTAALALLVTVGFAGVVVFAVAAYHYDDVSGWGLGAVALLLPNLGAAGLNLSWGGPSHVTDGLGYGSGARITFGLSDLSHVWSAWSVAAVVAGGVLCALVIGLLAVRRSGGRPEQFLVAGLFTALFVVLIAAGGAATDGSSHYGGDGERAHRRATASSAVPEALLFGLLWSFGGVLAVPYAARALGAERRLGGAAPYPPVPAAGGVPVPPQGPPAAAAGQPPVPGQPSAPPRASAQETVFDLGIVQPDRLSKERPTDGRDD